MVQAWLKVEENPTRTVQGFLRSLLEKEVVEALLVPAPSVGGESVTPTLFLSPNELSVAEPFAPLMPVSEATAVSMLTRTGNPLRLGAVMRNCQIRALVELVKFKQAQLDNLIIIGVDCPGTYELRDYEELVRKGVEPSAQLLEVIAKREIGVNSGLPFREACRMCAYPIPDPSIAAITVGILGFDGEKIPVLVRDDLAEKLGLADGSPSAQREEVIRSLSEAKKAERGKQIERFSKEGAGLEGLLRWFSKCIRCYNCMGVCPICYCRECVFRTPVFEHESARYFDWAQKKGALQLPPEHLLFHLTRMNHMVTSCVGCGLCTSACPADIDVALAFQSVGEGVQALFNYVPGRSLEEPAPVQTFQEREFVELGETLK
ncbi:MAG: 4Fe-4S dicluster domain-containing protein [Anaerolineae bacterium]|nr:4Fe-4S dicluster domain-containing protein [Anaerolineae bacterium]MDW8101693.1 4Fe-4S dicluster domain-containing protein [Anaerolineae bacterium]